jgi:hypothetical protein
MDRVKLHLIVWSTEAKPTARLGTSEGGGEEGAVGVQR